MHNMYMYNHNMCRYFVISTPGIDMFEWTNLYFHLAHAQSLAANTIVLLSMFGSNGTQNGGRGVDMKADGPNMQNY